MNGWVDGSYIVKLSLELVQHVFLDNNPLIIQVLDDKVMVDRVDVDDDGLDGGIALDQDTFRASGLACLFCLFVLLYLRVKGCFVYLE